MKKLISIIAIVFLTWLTTGIVHGSGTEDLTKISQNARYSWWVHPISSVDAYDTDNIYFTGVRSNGLPRVFHREPTEDYSELDYDSLIGSALEADDHNAPSILSADGKDTIAFWTRHGKESYVRYYKADEGTIDFGSENTISFPYNVTYSQSITNGDNIWLFTRSSATAWYFAESDDWGDTWGTAVNFIDGTGEGERYYTLLRPLETDSTKAQVVFYGHPNSTDNNIYYAELDTNNGNITTSAGTVGNLDGTNLPLEPGDLDTVWDTGGTQRVRVLDAGVKADKEMVLYAQWTYNTTEPDYKIAVRKSDDTWEHTRLQWSGGNFDDGNDRKYVWGAAFDRNGNDKIYFGEQANGIYRMVQQDLIVNSDDMVGLYNRDIIMADSSHALVRPYAVENYDGVIFQELIDYTSYSDNTFHLWLYEF